MRYFVFNWLGIRKTYIGQLECVPQYRTTTEAKELAVVCKQFPSRDDVINAIKSDDIENVTITNRFEFKSKEDYDNYCKPDGSIESVEIKTTTDNSRSLDDVISNLVISAYSAKLREPVIETCDEGHHKYYKEAGSDSRCPYCLKIGLEAAREEIDQLRNGEQKTYFIVWNKDKTEGFITDDHQLAYEVRKGSNTNCYRENGTACKVGMAFCNDWNDINCTIEELIKR